MGRAISTRVGGGRGDRKMIVGIKTKDLATVRIEFQKCTRGVSRLRPCPVILRESWERGFRVKEKENVQLSYIFLWLHVYIYRCRIIIVPDNWNDLG